MTGRLTFSRNTFWWHRTLEQGTVSYSRYLTGPDREGCVFPWLLLLCNHWLGNIFIQFKCRKCSNVNTTHMVKKRIIKHGILCPLLTGYFPVVCNNKSKQLLTKAVLSQETKTTVCGQSQNTDCWGEENFLEKNWIVLQSGPNEHTHKLIAPSVCSAQSLSGSKGKEMRQIVCDN